MPRDMSITPWRMRARCGPAHQAARSVYRQPQPPSRNAPRPHRAALFAGAMATAAKRPQDAEGPQEAEGGMNEEALGGSGRWSYDS